uniref:Uncharacterized protein n=1 Tax=Glossina austeni TaxID=7395 RepID=A0A1A9VHH0_GLOAU
MLLGSQNESGTKIITSVMVMGIKEANIIVSNSFIFVLKQQQQQQQQQQQLAYVHRKVMLRHNNINLLCHNSRSKVPSQRMGVCEHCGTNTNVSENIATERANKYGNVNANASANASDKYKRKQNESCKVYVFDAPHITLDGLSFFYISLDLTKMMGNLPTIA